MKDFLTIENTVEHVCLVKKSKFICTLSPIMNIEEGINLIKIVKSKFPDATHHCYVIIGIPGANEEKASDDGEPVGTAALPIRGALNSNSLYGIACVVARYFGGIKLGASGLARAYANSVVETIKNARIKIMAWSIIYSFSVTYSEADLIKAKAEEQGFILIETEYYSKVKMKVAVPIDQSQDFVKTVEGFTSGRIKPIVIKEEYIGYRR